ncbi:MAG: lipopolysaccharide transport periplasmic protein LptA [Deltaproteobacteria bacterium]|nr:lipopolysaccharide transport periplasmic protein LptA [Deltaproteobacteria bacterium]
MRGLRYSGVFVFAILLWLTFWCDSAQSTQPQEQIKKGGSGPMVIHSNTLEADDKKGVVIFTGDIEAKRDDFTVYCQKMVVYYQKSPERKDAPKAATKIDKIVATGQVKIVRTEGGVATGQKAVYYQKDEKLVLTGDPVVKQGDNSVEGDRITLFLKEDRSVVESSKEKRVKAIIFPKKDTGQGR